MGDLRGMSARHARTKLVSLAHFGEEVVYRSADGVSDDRVILCVVDRRDVEPLSPATTRVARLSAIVTIPRDPDVGVPLVTPGDILILAMRIGAAPIEARIVKRITEDEAMTEVEVASS